jgi:hypothetical protein
VPLPPVDGDPPPVYFDTMTQTPKTTLPAKANAATAASTM